MQGRANCQAPGTGTGAGLWVMGYGLWEIGVEIVWEMGMGVEIESTPSPRR